MLPWLAAAAIAGGVATGGIVWTLTGSGADVPTRFVHALPEGSRLAPGYVLAVSPDGNQFAYAALEGGLYVRSRGELDARAIPGTEAVARSPVYSPDGQWIAYQSGGRLLKIPVAGGTPTILCETPYAIIGADWSASDTILYPQRDGIWQVAAGGGQPTRLLDYDHAAAGAAFRYPQILPGRGALLYGSETSFVRRLRVKPRGGEPFSEISLAIQARYLATGHLVTLTEDGVLSAAPFDLGTLRPSGPSVPLVRGVAQFAISTSGALVYTKAREAVTPLSRLALVDRRGHLETISEPGRFRHPRFSPDSTRIAVQVDERDRSNIFVFDRTGRRLRQLTFDGGRVPVWTPTGREITFIAGEALWNVPSDFTGRPATLSTASQRFGIAPPFDWSPDGTVLFWDGAGGVAQLTLGSDGSATHGPLLVEAYSEGHPSFSRDGRWFAYNADETGRSELYIQPYPPDLGARRQITRAGGVAPMWVRNGEIVYENGNDLWSIRVSTSPTLSWEDPVRLVERKWTMTVGPYRNYDMSADGSRLLVLEPAETTASAPERHEVVVVLNWLDEVRQRVPID
jgi:Tol biopolymer transport system component